MSGRGASVTPRAGVARRAMVRHMTAAGAVPAFYLRRSADVTELLALRREMREQGGPVPSLNDFLVAAVAAALREHPHVNASWEDEAVHEHSRINVGVAVAVEGGLVVPALHDADAMDVHEISRAMAEIVALARARKLSRELLADATITVSNLGMFGIEDFDPLINPPQAAIIGVGAGVTGADGRVRLKMTMGCDHRVLTGAEGAPFLGAVAERLERPQA